jgi:RimJ/RimL family protein N-acetyltransferase
VPVHLPIGACTIRDFADGDRAALVKYADNPGVVRYLRDRFPAPYTLADAGAWLVHVRRQRPPTQFAIATDTELIGGIGLDLKDDVYRRSAEIGYWLGEPFWGRGIATAAVTAVCAWGFRTLDLARIYATVFEPNAASARVLEKAGFVREGRLRRSVLKHGVLLDELLYARVTGDAPPG